MFYHVKYVKFYYNVGNLYTKIFTLFHPHLRKTVVDFKS